MWLLMRRSMSFLLLAIALLLGGCVREATPAPDATPAFFLRALEQAAVESLRSGNVIEVWDEEATRDLEALGGWRQRADEAWQRLRTALDEICKERGYKRFSDREVWAAAMAVWMNQDQLKLMILKGEIDTFFRGYAKPAALATGAMIVERDRERRKAVREVALLN